MKKVILCSFLFVIACDSGGDATGMFSNLTDFPFPIGVAGAGVYNDHVYVFGGSTNYDGDSNYSSIYKFTGSEWVQVDTMLNDATWDGKLLIQGNDAYYVSGWNGTNGSLQKYNFANKTWTVLDTGNISTNWGTTAQLVGNKIYHFAASGQLDIYDISANQWTLGNGNGLVNDNIRTLTSTVYNGNIYLTGYGDSSLYKYDVAEGNFTLESKMPRSICSGAMVQHDGKIYLIGGSVDGNEANVYSDAYIYDLSNKSWSPSSLHLKTPSMYAAHTLFGNEVIIVGGIDINADGIRDAYSIQLD